jgi:hypothetical protein
VTMALPDRLDERHHVGGSRRRFPNVQRRLRRSPVGWLWKRLPQRTRSRAFIRFDHWNVRKDADDRAGARGARWSSETEARLLDHYGADEAVLARRFDLELPWRRA